MAPREQDSTPLARALVVVAGAPGMFGFVALLSGHYTATAVSFGLTAAMILPACYIMRERLPCYVRGHEWNRVEYGNKIRQEYKWCEECGKESRDIDHKATMETMLKEKLE